LRDLARQFQLDAMSACCERPAMHDRLRPSRRPRLSGALDRTTPTWC
jgi:hypothetical protein